MFVILLLEIGYNYLGDRESNIACPVYCLKFTIQCNQGLISCIDRGLGLHEYFFFFHLLGKEFLQNIVITMALVSKSSMKTYYYVNKGLFSQGTPSFPPGLTWKRSFVLQFVLHFPELLVDKSKLKKVQGIFQHFSRQFVSYYIPK